MGISINIAFGLKEEDNMKRIGSLLGVALILGSLQGCSPNDGGSTTPVMVTVSGTATNEFGPITGTPTVELQQGSVVKYALEWTNYYDSGSGVNTATLADTTILAGTYDIVITINAYNTPTSEYCSCTVNGVAVTGTVNVAGTESPYVITIPGVPIVSDATIVLDIGYGGGW
jgi:hypothetical protein